MTSIASIIDHTLLSPDANETAIRKLCEEAWIHQFKGVCVAPAYVAYTREMLEFCPVPIEIATVVGYPFGYSTTATKLYEAKQAIENGATEIEVVMNIAWFKSMAYSSVQTELTELVKIAHDSNSLLKTVIQTNFLDSFDLYTACEIATESGTDFVQIPMPSFEIENSNEAAIKIRSLLPPTVKLKVAGEIMTQKQASALLHLGVERIGTKHGVSIVSEI